MEYRVLEYDGRFKIQAALVKYRGFWIWKKAVKTWVRTDINGHPLMYYPQIGIDTARQIGKEPEHKTLKEAEAKIRSWRKGPIVHEVPD